MRKCYSLWKALRDEINPVNQLGLKWKKEDIMPFIDSSTPTTIFEEQENGAYLQEKDYQATIMIDRIQSVRGKRAHRQIDMLEFFVLSWLAANDDNIKQESRAYFDYQDDDEGNFGVEIRLTLFEKVFFEYCNENEGIFVNNKWYRLGTKENIPIEFFNSIVKIDES